MKNLCSITCLDFEPENLSLNLFFGDRLPKPDLHCRTKMPVQHGQLAWVQESPAWLVDFGVDDERLRLPDEPAAALGDHQNAEHNHTADNLNGTPGQHFCSI